MSIQRVKFFLILLLVSISTIALSAEDVPVAAPIALTDALKSAISANPSPQNVTDLVTANRASAVAITLAAITAAPDSAAAITAAAITAAPDFAAAITAAAITAPGVNGNPTLQAAITYAAIKANPSLRDAIIAAAVAAAPDAVKAIAAAAVAATAEAAGSTIAVSSSTESTINNQALQAENFAAALTACNGNAACIADKAAIMASSSSLTAAEIKAVEISVSPN